MTKKSEKKLKSLAPGLEKDSLNWRYPEIEPYKTDMLKVSKVHTIYYEESGNPKGKPVIFVHGGPGGGTEPGHRRYFDPRRYRIILFDQRGCGKSTPYASLEDNTTWHLVEDMEKLRHHLAIEKWQVFGGSWGSTLALAYAQTHPDAVLELVLRGIFMVRQKEIDWFYQYGASAVFPEAWEPYESEIPKAERHDFVSAYYKRLTSNNIDIQRKAAIAWSTWEGRTSKLIPEKKFVEQYSDADFALAFARIECHYFINKGFMKEEGQLLKNIDRIRHIPTVIVQGRYDMCCPMQNAWDLHRAWPESELIVVPDAGHSAGEAGISRALVASTDRLALL